MDEPRGRAPVAFALGLVMMTGLVAFSLPAAAQGLLGPCTVLPCEFSVATASWNGTGEPGAFLTGMIRITNEGESEDAYRIAVSVDNETWEAEADPNETELVQPGSGVLAGDNHTVDVQIRVAIPREARAGAGPTVRVEVTSQNDDALEAQDLTLATEVLPVRLWDLSCTEELSVAKTQEGTVELFATNLGNGRDRATVETAPLAGLQVDPVEAFDLAAGATASREVPVGVGLALEDGNYTLRWDLTSEADAAVTATCTTTLLVTGGADDDGDDGDGGDEEGPAAPAILALLLVALLIARRRRGGRSL